MGLGSNIKNMSRKSKIITSVIAAVVVAAVAVVCIIISQNGFLATTMRLLRVQGTVNIEDSKGSSKPVIDNLRFQSGDALNTGSDGLASVGLDDTKIITLQNDSRAEFKKKRNRLELKLTKGAVFFNVTEKLRSDETFEIKTSTMTAGIRGTSGIIYYDSKDENRQSVMVTDGVVEISATNPNDNVTRTVKVEGGKKAKVYFYENDVQHDSVEFTLEDITFEDLSLFMLEWIAEDEELLNRISAFNDWDKVDLKNVLLGLAGKNNPPPAPSVPDPEPPVQPTAPTEPDPEPPAPPTTAPKKPTSKKKKKKKKRVITQAPVKKKKKTSSAPSVPKGWSKYSAGWGKSYNGHKVYIITQNNEMFKGYLRKKWVVLDQSYDDVETGDGEVVEYMFFYTNGGSVYYKKKAA